MPYLSETDYNVQIRTFIRQVITASNGATLTQAEAMAQEEICSYLSGKYDCEAIFAATGASRNPLIVMYMVDIALYHLYTAITPNDIPQIRLDRYERAVQWLKDVAKDLLNPNLPLLDTSAPSTTITLGGDKRVSEKW